MERIRWINHKGHKILMLDYSSLLENKFLLLIEKATDFQLNLTQGEILAVCDVSNTRATPKVIRASKIAKKQLSDLSVPRKLAMIGFNRMQRILANIVKKDIYFAANLDDAFNWLEKQSEKSHSKNLHHP